MSKTKFLLFSLIFTLSEISAQPTVTQITPNVGPARTAATPAITIQGTGFVDVTDVQIGGVSLGTSFTVVNDTTITVPGSVLPQAVPGTVGITVTTTTVPSPDNHPFDYFTYQGDWLLYVPEFGQGEGVNQGFVYVFDITQDILDDINKFTATPIVTLETGDRSEMVVVSHDGAFAVCTNNISDNISVIDGAYNDQAHVVNKPLPAGQTSPIGIAISPGTEDIYLVADYFSTGVSQFPDNFAYTVNSNPTSAAFKPNPANLLAFVPNEGSNLITVIDPINKMTGNYTDGNLSSPCWVAPYPVTESNADYNYMVLNNDGSGEVLFYSMDFNQAFAQTPFILGTVFTTDRFEDVKQILASPDSSTAYVTSNDGTIPRIDLKENPPALLTTTLSVPHLTNGIALTPDGTIGFAANNVGESSVNLTIFDTTTLATKSVRVINTFPTHFESFNLTKLSVTPDQAPVAYASYRFLNDNTVQFDGSGSLSPTGKVNLWQWDFGDGNHILMNSPIPPPHTYTPRAAPYVVTLTVTNTAGTSTTQTHFGSMVYKNGGPPAIFSFSLDVLPLLPPANPHIAQCVDRFLLQTCYENIITFSPPVNSIPPVAYLIYSDPQRRHLLEKIPASGPLKFTICERVKHATYYLFSEDANGSISETYTTVCI